MPDTRREMKFPVPASVFLRLHRCLVVLSLTMKGTSFLRVCFPIVSEFLGILKQLKPNFFFNQLTISLYQVQLVCIFGSYQMHSCNVKDCLNHHMMKWQHIISGKLCHPNRYRSVMGLWFLCGRKLNQIFFYLHCFFCRALWAVANGDYVEA